jgi:small-conductance mechanosensitive channel
MAQPPAVKEVQTLITSISSDLRETTIVWQLAAIAIAFAAAWAINRWLRPRLTGMEGRWRAGLAGIERALFPVSALLCVLVGEALLAEWNPISLLRLTEALLVALAIVRVVGYLLRSAFNDSPKLEALERAIGWFVWIGLALHLANLLPAIRGFLGGITFPIGKHEISLLLMIRGAFSVVVTLLIALWLGRLIESRLMSSAALDINLRTILSKLVKAVLILFAVLFALSAVGLDLTLLSVFGGALGVGLGFGLQKIASNYVSGFIILADRSVSIGNTVTIDSREGVVTRMTSRYVVVRSLDGTEAIIPNETIITSTVVSQSYSDPRVRVPIPIQIAYESDLEATIALMLEIAREHPRVLADPGPTVVVQMFADSGINLELGVWINDPDAGRGNLRSDLYRALWKAFQKHEIRIPYPQREVRVIGAEPLPEAGNRAVSAGLAGQTGDSSPNP